MEPEYALRKIKLRSDSYKQRCGVEKSYRYAIGEPAIDLSKSKDSIDEGRTYLANKELITPKRSLKNGMLDNTCLRTTPNVNRVNADLHFGNKECKCPDNGDDPDPCRPPSDRMGVHVSRFHPIPPESEFQKSCQRYETVSYGQQKGYLHTNEDQFRTDVAINNTSDDDCGQSNAICDPAKGDASVPQSGRNRVRADEGIHDDTHNKI